MKRILFLLLLSGCITELPPDKPLFPPSKATLEELLTELKPLEAQYFWHISLERGKIVRMSLTSEEILIETDADLLVCVDRHSGERRWVYELPAPLNWAPVTPPSIPQEIADLEKKLERAYDLEIQELNKEKRDQDPLVIERCGNEQEFYKGQIRLAVNSDNLYFVTKGSLYCLDRKSGQEVWTARLKFVPSARPYAVKDWVFVPAADSAKVWALSVPKKGDHVMFYTPSLEDENQIFNQPIYIDKVLVFGAHDKKLHAFIYSTGKKLWEADLGAPVKCDPVEHKYKTTLPDGKILEYHLIAIGGLDRYFYAIDADSGTIVWKYFTDVTIKTPAICKDDTIYVRMDNRELVAFYAIPIDEGIPTRVGKIKYRFSSMNSFLVKGQKDPYLLTQQNSIMRVDNLNGNLIKKADFNKLQFFLTNIHDNTLYASTDDGFLVAVKVR